MRSASSLAHMRITQTESDQLVAGRIAAEVRAEIGRQGMSQQALADRLGWPQPRLSRRLTDGKTAVPFTVVELTAVASTLGVPLAQFLPAAPPSRLQSTVAA